MTVLGWVFRVLLIILIVRLILRAFAGSRPRQRPTARQSPPTIERAGGTLVRDPHCGTYLPVSRAIRVGSGANAQFFCSEACREAYRSRSSVA